MSIADGIYDVIIIGGGQSGLATAYYLQKKDLDFLVLDEQERSGGAWLHTWMSLHLFSEANGSSLPGWPMPATDEEYPKRQEVIKYLEEYERRYEIPVKRPVKVLSVNYSNEDKIFILHTSEGVMRCKAVVSATGNWKKPFIPPYPNKEQFKGKQIHSAFYRSPEEFQGKKVLVVGAGNSGAQILAEVSKVAETVWVTKKEPSFLPDELDGKDLFHIAHNMHQARKKGEHYEPPGSLDDIVMVDSVLEARERGVYKYHLPFNEMYEDGIVWDDGTIEEIDAVIWCTGFKPALDHLRQLYIFEENGRVRTKECKVETMPGLWLVGYGGWTGYASATIIGVGRTAQNVAEEIEEYLKEVK
jgi:putative flavoprotein involved in K+ transport